MIDAYSTVSPQVLAREKTKAKELRKTTWWRQKLAAGLCNYCEKPFKPQDLTMDHVVPLARGGLSTRGNIVPACKPCNNEKKWKTPAEMILEREALHKKL